MTGIREPGPVTRIGPELWNAKLLSLAELEWLVISLHLSEAYHHLI